MHLRILLLIVMFIFTIKVSAQIPPPKPKPTPASVKDFTSKNWEDFVSLEGKFKARFPQIPEKRTIIKHEDLETVKQEYRSGNEEFILYKIQYENVAELALFQTKPESLFETVKNQRIKELEKPVSIFSEKYIKRGQCPAQYIEYDAGKDLRYRDLYVLCNDNLYQVSIRTFRNIGTNLMGAENAYEKVADAFIGSFVPLNENDLKGLKKTRIQYSGLFRDDETRFKVAFPAYPEITEEINSDGLSDVSFVSNNGNYEYRVFVDNLTTTFSFSERLRELFYDNSREGFVSTGGKVFSDKSIEYKGIRGRDLIVKLPDTIGKFYFRIFALNGRLYTLSVVDKSGEVSVDSDKFAEVKVKDFFNSFEKLFEFQPPKYYGIVYDGVYTSEFYGFSINVPKGWQVKGGQLMISSTDKNTTDLVFDEPENRLFKPIFLQAVKPDEEKSSSSIFKISGNFSGVVDLNIDSVVKGVSKTILETSDNIKIINDFKPITVNQKQIWQADFVMDTEDMKNLKFRNYIIQHGKYFLTINAIYLTEADLKSVEDAIESLKFFEN